MTVVEDYVVRPIARFITWLNAPSEVLDNGCPNCYFLLVNRDEYDSCPHCGWGPDTEPELTAEEAREKFLDGVHAHVNYWRTPGDSDYERRNEQ